MDGFLVEETSSYTYDAQNQITSTTDPKGNATYTEYDLAGNESASVDAKGYRTEYLYDAYRRLHHRQGSTG